MRERRTKKFMLALSPSERTTLQQLADRERLSAAALLRRLVWLQAEKCGVLPSPNDAQGQEGQQR
jgi:hypothetical protein